MISIEKLRSTLVILIFFLLVLLSGCTEELSIPENDDEETEPKTEPTSEPEPELELMELSYGGAYYPDEFLLKKLPFFWRTYNLSVKHTLYSSGAEANYALLAGDIDINCVSDTKTISLFNAAAEAGNIEPLIIGITQHGDRYSTIIPNDSTKTSWTELLGKRIGYRAGTGAHTVMLRYFTMDPDNLTLDFDDFN